MTLKTMLQRIAKVGWKITRKGQIRTKRKFKGRHCCPLEVASVMLLGHERPIWCGIRSELGLRQGMSIASAADLKHPALRSAIRNRALMLKILKPEGRK